MASLEKTRRLLLEAAESLNGTTRSGDEVRCEDIVTASSSTSQHASDATVTPLARRNVAITERNKLFNYHTKSKTGSGKGKGSLGKKRKIPLRVWTREFICLARTGDNRPPSSLEAGQLMMAGLGRKSITFFEHGDAADVHDEIMAAFPVLRENGYELLRAGPKNSNLQLIPPPPGGYYVQYLKEVVRNAKVYIRPLQNDLPIEIIQPDLFDQVHIIVPTVVQYLL